MKLALGHNVEDLICEFLQYNDVIPLYRNYYTRRGEIDIVANDHDILTICEVRYRRQASHGDGLESVTIAKQSKLLTTAQEFLSSRPWLSFYPLRFDVLSVSEMRPLKIDWIKNAFHN